jgi:hypothetical protein
MYSMRTRFAMARERWFKRTWIARSSSRVSSA